MNICGLQSTSKEVKPSIHILTDPLHNSSGKGERIFINDIGAAAGFTPDYHDEDFFDSDMVVFGGTALVPEIHRNLTGLLKKAKIFLTIRYWKL